MSQWVASYAKDSSHTLGIALASKANKQAVAKCACLDKTTVPSIVNELGELTDAVSTMLCNALICTSMLAC